MDEQRKKDFLKVKTMISQVSAGKYTPGQLGKIMKEYLVKYNGQPVLVSKSVPDLDDPTTIFDGKIPY